VVEKLRSWLPNGRNRKQATSLPVFDEYPMNNLILDDSYKSNSTCNCTRIPISDTYEYYQGDVYIHLLKMDIALSIVTKPGLG
jgi:hypothetical protein